MNVFFSPDVVLPWLLQGAVLLAFMALGLLFYAWLADRAIFEGLGRVHAQSFGRVDAVIAAGLSLMFALLIVGHLASTPSPKHAPSPSDADMIGGVVASTTVFLLIIGGIVGGLVVRGISCRQAFGFTRASFAKVILSAVVLLFAAYPLIVGAMQVARLALAAAGYDDEGPQEIVRFLGSGGHGTARAVVAVSAVLLAPIQEEFIFRGYIYGVCKRYAGVGVGVIVNATLFAGIHLHAPSFGPLLVLAVCLTLAYEWTGSIFVPMAVHALFNSLTVVSLLRGGNNL